MVYGWEVLPPVLRQPGQDVPGGDSGVVWVCEEQLLGTFTYHMFFVFLLEPRSYYILIPLIYYNIYIYSLCGSTCQKCLCDGLRKLFDRTCRSQPLAAQRGQWYKINKRLRREPHAAYDGAKLLS